MAHFLYRPHIFQPGKTVTPDFQIFACVMQEVRLPVACLCSSSECEVDTGTERLFAAVFLWGGQEHAHAAPAIVIAPRAGGGRGARCHVSRAALTPALEQGEMQVQTEGVSTRLDLPLPLTRNSARILVAQELNASSPRIQLACGAREVVYQPQIAELPSRSVS